MKQLLVIAALIAITAAVSFFAPYDDTDPPNGRSGMALHTDHLTGCQYLGKPFGGITPRLGPDGKQICKGGTP